MAILKYFLLRIAVIGVLSAVISLSANAQTRYLPTWESIDSQPTPQWFTDAKFGIFLCWGNDSRHMHGGFYPTEYGSGLDNDAHPWEENRGMGYSYGYNRAENLEDYRNSQELILMLVDIVSRGGNLCLDIGPAADGQIPVIMQERLVQIGNWLKINGETIYGTRMCQTPVPVKRLRRFSSSRKAIHYTLLYLICV